MDKSNELVSIFRAAYILLAANNVSSQGQRSRLDIRPSFIRLATETIKIYYSVEQ